MQRQQPCRCAPARIDLVEQRRKQTAAERRTFVSSDGMVLLAVVVDGS